MSTQPQPDGGTQTPEAAGPAPASRLLGADFLISAVLFVVFLAAYLGARDWPFDSRMFPHIVTVTGMGLALLKMATSLRGPRRRKTVPGTRVGGVELTDEDDEEDEALEYVFEKATRWDWIRVLSWAGGFFLALLLVGTIPTVLVFTLAYLLVEGRTSLLVAAVYAAVLTGLLYAARELLHILLPAGLLFS